MSTTRGSKGVTSGELARVAALQARFRRTAARAKGVRVGIGDDAAVLGLEAFGAATSASGATAESALVWTVDAQVEGTHFRRGWASWEDVGWRSFMAAASDLAAMGAEPVAALSALVLAPSVDDEVLDAIARGQAAAAEEIGAAVVGGNLARGTETSITTTLLGRAANAVLRSGARPGDALWLAGPVGLAAVGLALVDEYVHDPRNPSAAAKRIDFEDDDTAPCIQAWRRPVARIAEGRVLAAAAHAAIDVSDGLARDAWQLAEASGVRLVLDLGEVLAAGGEALASGAAIVGRDPVELALHGGEDYALLAASAKELPGFMWIGTVESAEDGAYGGARLVMTTARGTMPIEPRGFDHFA